MNATETQKKVFENLIDQGAKTLFGKEHNIKQNWSVEDFQKNVPISKHEDLQPYIAKMRNDEPDVLWPGHIGQFSKSSGTTSVSKFIPVSEEALQQTHFRGGKDALAFYFSYNPESKLVDGKNVGMCGSLEEEGLHVTGDVSAIIAKTMPWYAKQSRRPSEDIALLPTWEEKLEPMAQALINEDVRTLAGVPSWMLHLCRKILDISKKENLHDVWPNLEHMFHGGISMKPYMQPFLDILNADEITFQEVYNASEGFFAAQDTFGPHRAPGMLLFINHGIFYEFAPLQNQQPQYDKCITISEVEINKPYALVITTNAGLWRYDIGDVITFTSTHPYRIEITGRTKSFINLCGEEVMVHNTDKAFADTIKQFNIDAAEYTAAPFAAQTKDERSRHEWIIATNNPPKNKKEFATTLDNILRTINSDYNAKRTGDIALQELKIYWAPKDIFETWMKQNQKTSIQTKVPRLANNRNIFDQIYKLIPTK